MANYNEMTSKELRELCKANGIPYNTSKDGKKHTLTKDEMVNALYDYEENSYIYPRFHRLSGGQGQSAVPAPGMLFVLPSDIARP